MAGTSPAAGLGTLGFNPEVAESMSRKAGFTRFKPHDFRDPEGARPGRA